MKKILQILLFLTGIPVSLMAQDIQLTQFYAQPIYLNPAFAGDNVCSRFSLTYRNQWRGLGEAYITKMAAFDHAFTRANMGVGVLFAQDEAGAGGLRTTVINPVVSYEARIDKFTAVRFGLQPGITMKSININRLIFGDQIYRGGGVATVEQVPQTRTYFDMGAGAIFSKYNYWVGVSAFHLNMPNESMYGSLFGRLPVKYSIHAGAKFDLNPDERDENLKRYITPVFHYRGQKKFDQVDIGFYYTKSFFTLGAWYRGIPGLKAYQPGYANHDAIALVFGMQAKKIRIGYSYDNTLSDLVGISKGAHEV